jgi:hypothetical protein
MSDDPILELLRAIRGDIAELSVRVDDVGRRVTTLEIQICSLLATPRSREVCARTVQRGQIGIYRIEAQIEEREEGQL